MNASAYLKGHGWRGDGFSLDSTNRGLSKPLLVQHKLDLAGLGTKKNDFADQWWLTSFDKSLEAIGRNEEPVRTVAEAPPVQKSSLYSKFVKAETLESTIKLNTTSEIAREPLSEHILSPTRMSMSTLPAGFVLGESPSTPSLSAPVVTTREKRGKKRKHEEKALASTAQPEPEKERTIASMAQPEPRKEERKKKKKKHEADIVASVANEEHISTMVEQAEKLSKTDEKAKRKSASGVEGGIVLDPPTQDAEESAPGFISITAPSDGSEKVKTKARNKTKTPKSEEPEKPAKHLPAFYKPKTDAELGFPDAKGIPIIHPKTGQPLSKKARKIIAKKKSKMEMKNGRAEVRARRQAKKAERAKQAAAKKKASGETPAQPKEKKSEKYARQKAIRVAKREAKASFAAGKGTGANGTPLA